MHENVVVKQKVKVPAEKVWAALTDRAQIKEWYFDIPDFELREHAEFNFFEPGGENKFHHHCEILEVIPQKKLKHTWTYPEFSKEKTIVTWKLEEENEETEITVSHKGLENLDNLGKDFKKENFEQGWTEIVTKNLKKFVEK